MRIFYGLGILLLSCAGAEAAPPAPFRDGCMLERQAALPFTIAHGHIDVAVTIDGHPFTFGIDTGGFYSTLSPRAVQALGLTQHDIRADLAVSDIGGGKTAKYVRVDSLIFGQVKSDNVQLMVADLGREDGLIGPELLRNFDLELDFDTRQLNFFKHHRCDDQVVWWTDDYAAVPFTVTAQGHIRLPVRLNGVDLTAMLDTGAPGSVIGAPTMTRKLAMEAPTSFGGAVSGGSGGKLGVAAGKFTGLQIGKFLWPDPPILVSAEEGGWHKDDCDLLLGLRELSGLHLYIDYRGKALYISRRTPVVTGPP